MFALVKNETVITHPDTQETAEVEVISLFAPYTVWSDKNGTQHSPDILFNLSIEQKEELGIYDVAYGTRADDRFYNITENSPVFDSQLKIVKVEYTATPKNLDGENGLKDLWSKEFTYTASKSLEQTDWYLIRKLERNVDVPADVAAYRASIVAEHTRLTNALASVETVEDLISLVQSQNWNPGA